MVAWTLVFHIIGLVFWVGSLLVVTHVLTVHTEEASTEAREALSRVESKLLRGLAHPGAALMVITGVILVSRDPHLLREHWLHAKLLLVFVLVGLDLRVTFRTKAFHDGTVQLSRGECRALHGAISFVFFAILILVLLKPFGPSRHQAQGVRPEQAVAAVYGRWPALIERHYTQWRHCRSVHDTLGASSGASGLSLW